MVHWEERCGIECPRLFLQPRSISTQRASDRLLRRRWPQTIHGRAVDAERARHLGDGFAGGDPVYCLPTLVRRELLWSPEAHAARLGLLAALGGPGAD
jgi:hypothetical protein